MCPTHTKSIQCIVKSVNATTSTYELLPSTTAMPIAEEPTTPSVTHDYTDCCQSLNVSTKCLGFCTVHNILDGTTGIEPELCETDFPNIVKCMADGRNHLPCCKRKSIPDLCQVKLHFNSLIIIMAKEVRLPYLSAGLQYSNFVR